MEPIVIVGGGIIGAGLVYHLGDAPCQVHLLEKNALGSGTTGASIAVFSWLQNNPSAFEHRLRVRSWDAYSSLIDEGEISFEQIGALLCAESKETLTELERSAEKHRSLGMEVEMIAPAELNRFNVEAGDLQGALHMPNEGYLDPTEIIRYWTDHAASDGVDIVTDVEVTDVLTQDGAVTGVSTDGGDIDAGTVINATGPWAPSVANTVGVSLPIRHTPGRILVLQKSSPVTLPFVIFENGEYFREEGKNQVFAGALEKDYANTERFDPDAAYPIENEFRTTVAEHTEQYLPMLEDADIVNEWVGLRAVTPDGDPILGPTEIDGFHNATGMSGLGITRAPAVTSALANFILTDSSEIVDRFLLSRFDG